MERGTGELLRLREEELDWREVEGEIVALDLRASEYLAVNGTGLPLWAALASGATRDELVDGLVETHDLERIRAEQDVDAFLADLESRDLLCKSGAG